jgi:shikimate kinase
VGRELAARTGWPYRDNDELLQRAVGESAPDLLRDRGEAALRAAESQALTVALTDPPPLVAGIAGGVVLDPGDRARLVGVAAGGGLVAWLRASVETLVRRVGPGEGRAWLAPDPEAALRRMAGQRDAFYAEVAGLTVDVDDLDAAAAAQQILAALPEA